MKDMLKFKGHFKIEAIDANNNGTVLDEWQDDNLIMENARLSMAEMFSLLSSNIGIHKIVLGSKGHNVDYRIPKTSSEGFVASRDRLFSESIDIDDGEIVAAIRLGDVVKYVGSGNGTGTQNNYYEYIGTGLTNKSVDSINFANTAVWTDLGATAPYTYTMTFGLPNIPYGTFLNVVEDDGTVGSTGIVSQTDGEVQFVFEFSTLAANNGNDPVAGASTFTEAAMYANNRIFSMKTFGSKIKDSTVLLRVTWTIVF